MTEEIFIGSYIIRRIDEKKFEIENAWTGGRRIVSEERLEKLLEDFWRR